jgi:hypothetical protein
MKVRLVAVSMLLPFAACAKKAPQASPTPAAERVKPGMPTRTEVAPGVTRYEFAEPPEDVFVDLMVAAAGWAKGMNGGRSTGVYQPEGADARFMRAVEAVTARYALRPIAASDFGVVCTSGGNRTSISGQTASCSMKYVDAVLAFNNIRQGADSGYVGLSITRVPTGQNRSERVYYCITLANNGQKWEPKRNKRVNDPERCWRRVP